MLDKVLPLAAIVQTIITTMRAGSRAFYILKDGEIGVMKGPLILPPIGPDETYDLFDLSEAFRDAVTCAQESSMVNEVSLIMDRSPKKANDELVSVSTEVSGADSDIYEHGGADVDDETVEDFLESVEMGEQLTWKERSEAMWKSMLIPVRRFGILSSTLPRSGWNAALSFIGHGDEEWDQDEFLDGSIDFSKADVRELVLERGEDETIPSRVVDIKAYAPSEFSRLRTRFGIKETDYFKSILDSGPFVSFQSNSKGAARSGGIFFFTRDGKYMIKTIKRAEIPTLFRMLPKYSQFMRRNGRRSLLTRICGMYEVRFEDSKQRYAFVVTNSVFPAESASIVTERFDLKGSTVGRQCSEAERLSKGAGAVLKDLDLLREVEVVKSYHKDSSDAAALGGYGLHIGPIAKAKMLTQLRKDVKLLVECGVIDYSLLVGIAKLDISSYSEPELKAIAASEEGKVRLELVGSNKIFDAIRSSLIKPVNVLVAPPLYFYRKSWSILRRSLFWPLPYYGSGDCGIDAGNLARLYGDRGGHSSLFYLGVIDFLQPFNMQKKAEWKIKTWVYGQGFSCVPPEHYADRFLAFLESNIS